MKITNHHQELRKRTTIDCSSPIMTDQSDKNTCDVNYIMKNYAKTGMLSHVTNKIAKYQDNTQVPQLETAFKIVSEAVDAFSALPADIRKLMDNDPSQLETFLQKEEYSEILIKHGLKKRKEVVDITDKIKKEASDVKNS